MGIAPRVELPTGMAYHISRPEFKHEEPEVRRNVLRELLDADKPSVGTHIHSIWPGMVEVIGYSGAMDYIEFSGEYAPYDLSALENFGRAVDLFDDMSSMMKIEQQPSEH